ncbi:MAG: hypothetical protein GY805_37510 [Chloroflexi bacterium]|nr:hypothetical protein [Chloroflexota bacterium]
MYPDFAADGMQCGSTISLFASRHARSPKFPTDMIIPCRWIDGNRFLYFEDSSETNESNTLFLVGLDGTKTAVAQLDTAFAQFDFYFESGR